MWHAIRLLMLLNCANSHLNQEAIVELELMVVLVLKVYFNGIFFILFCK